MRERFTIDEWIEKIPQKSARTKARYARMANKTRDRDGEYGGDFVTLGVALRCAFDWRDTPQGVAYWSKIASGMVIDGFNKGEIK